MEWKIDKKMKNKVLEFQKAYEQEFQEELQKIKDLTDEVWEYIKEKGQWEDEEAILDWISVFPSGIFRRHLFGRYYELADEKEIDYNALDTRCPEIDGELLHRTKILKKESIQRSLHRQKMESAVKKECFSYLKKTGLWNDPEAVYEMGCLLPVCALRHELDKRYYELESKKEKDKAEP